MIASCLMTIFKGDPYENVKGMLSSNNGWDYAAIQIEMESCGYDIQCQLTVSRKVQPGNASFPGCANHKGMTQGVQHSIAACPVTRQMLLDYPEYILKSSGINA